MRRRAPFVWLVVALLALTGCSEPQQANDTLPTAPATTSAEPTLEPLGPADFPVPDDARVQTEAGAIAMATYYLDLIDHIKDEVGTALLDAEPLRDLSNQCEVCDQVAAGFEGGQGAGYIYEGGDLAAPVIGPVTVAGRTADIAFVVQQADVRVLSSDGAEVRASAAVDLRGGIVFDWDAVRDGWIATQLNLTNS